MNLSRFPFRQFLLYALSGGTAAVVDFGTYSLLVYLGIWYVAASVAGSVGGFFTTFLLMKYAVFKKPGKVGVHFGKFFLVDMGNSLLNTGILFLLVDEGGLEKHVAKLVVMGMVVCWNFLIYKFFVYT